MSATVSPNRYRRISLHAVRLLMFVVILVLIRIQHAELKARQQSLPVSPVDVAVLRKLFPGAQAMADEQNRQAAREVLDGSGESLGYVLQTSPGSDHLIGFSGPTNALIAFGSDDRIVGIELLSSGDTREHVAQVLQDDRFFKSFNGLTWEEAAQANVDAVSGATLTSIAIQESIIHRLGGGRPSLRFPEPLTIDDARKIFDLAHTVSQDEDRSSLWSVRNEWGEEIGSILRTTPFADNIVGYQGPTEARICFDPTDTIIGFSIGKSYDNAEYVTYVRDDEYFLSRFNNLKLSGLANFDLENGEVEGVSGATMTSMAVANGLIVAAEQHRQAAAVVERRPESILKWAPRDFGTAAVIVSGLAIALTTLRGKTIPRLGFQLLLIVYLGLINGDMLSQAMLVGWAQSGVPWTKAGGLVLLTAAAFLVPITTGRNAYCSHLCPHGAVQQLVKNRLPWRLRLPPRLSSALAFIPAVLLLWCLFVALIPLSFSLVDIEPFDAWVFRVAGWATISIAIVGLIASLFIPMAYCRFGCPTGALLGFLRYNSRSDEWSRRDSFTLVLIALATGLAIAI